MPKQVMFKNNTGDVTILSIGDTITLNSRAHKAGVAPAGSIVELYCWHWDDPQLIGLRAVKPEYHENWGDLDEDLPTGTGWWIHPHDLSNMADIIDTSVKYVSVPLKFKGRELKGMECKILSYIEKTPLVFAEFNIDIGGCSADGLGKRGHCIAIKKSILRDAKSKSKSKE